MLLDLDGRELRRVIGFHREYVRAKEETKGEIHTFAIGFSVPAEEHDALEECERGGLINFDVSP